MAIFKIPELRQKILITLLFLAIYRIGFHVPLPMIDQAKMAGADARQLGRWASARLRLDVLRRQPEPEHIFGLGIMPYISASIIFQLLASVYPPLEKLQKEGESGRKKINEYTRYATVLICFVPGVLLRAATSCEPTSRRPGLGHRRATTASGTSIASIVTMTAGTIFLMWLGEQIDEYGIGNGISLIIMAGIIARIPDATTTLFFDTTASFKAVDLHARRRRHRQRHRLRKDRSC